MKYGLVFLLGAGLGMLILIGGIAVCLLLDWFARKFGIKIYPRDL